MTPPVGEFPFKVIFGVVQLMTPPEALAEGGVLLSVTEVVAVAVQLFVGLVTVTV